MWWLSCILSNVALASILALAAWFVQRRHAWHGLARLLWLLVLVKLITPPLVSVPLGERAEATDCSLGKCGCTHHATPDPLVPASVPWLLLAAWSAGAGATVWMGSRRWTRFRRLLAHASNAPREWQLLATRLAAELSLRRVPEVLAAPGRLPPLVVPGWRRPRIVLPIALLDRLDDSQRASLILHELVHIRRGDHLVRLLEFAVSVAYWWLPVVGWIGRQLRTCEEICCDAAVVAHLPHARRDYARLLLDVIDFASPLPRHAVPQPTAMSAGSDLEQRLLAIINDAPPPRRTWPYAALALAVACAILPCELRYDVAQRPAAAATLSEPRPAAIDAVVSGDNRDSDPFAVYCCPS